MAQPSKKIIILGSTSIILVMVNLILLFALLSKNPLVKIKNSLTNQTNSASLNLNQAEPNLNAVQATNNLITLDPAIILQSESIIKSLLNADNVFIHSNQEIADIDNDGREELVVFATVVGGQRPEIATGSWQDYRDMKTTDDLIVLAQNDDTSYQFKYYYIEAFSITNAPGVWLQDFNRDNKLEIILTTGSKEKQFYLDVARIYQLNDNQLNLIQFIQGPFNNATEISGALEIEESKGIYLDIYLDAGLTTTASYQLNEKGQFEFISTTSNPPSTTEQKVIDYLTQNITKLVMAKPDLGATSLYIGDIQYYPDNKFLVAFSDGHFMGYFYGQYALDNDQVAIKYIAETTSSAELNRFRLQYSLDSTQAINYSSGMNGYQKVGSDIFKF